MITRNYDFERIYRNFFTILHKDFYLLDPDEATNFIYWSDDILYNIWGTKADNRDLMNFCFSAYQHSALTPNVCVSLSVPEFQLTNSMPNTAYLGEITYSDYKRIGKEISESKLLQKYFFVHSFLKKTYISNTVDASCPSEYDYKYCIYVTIESQKDLENLTMYSRLVKKNNNT